MVFVIILAIIIVAIIIYVKFFRLPSFNTINFIDGTNGVGKTEVCVYWSRRAKRRLLLKYKIFQKLHKIFKKRFYTDIEPPYLYSNLAMRDTPFVRVTSELLTRENWRCSFDSVLLLDEYSLVADQNVYGKQFVDVCEKMRDFWKLCRHEGFKRVFVNSQNISSINYTLKDCMSNYIYIHHRKNIGFGRFGFSIIYYYEMAYSRDDKNIMNTFSNRDSDYKKCIVPNKIFTKYDSRAYSIFTDNLPIDNRFINLTKKDSLKQKELVSFMPLNYLYKNLGKEKEKEIKINEVKKNG